ncbi:hypothetical protein IGI04_030557 [Brassica rapa subsp. trilocularis]|uniref:Uncharacterized protein n=1 Tax=Brassica rapa subsp. trilocularis TaxID=1813537 RepID=A0ABQ7LV13_BRACM|nr:hypothetical protein IGI04_030557 [Brassica rapa subsp. trilocularis]
MYKKEIYRLRRDGRIRGVEVDAGALFVLKSKGAAVMDEEDEKWKGKEIENSPHVSGECRASAKRYMEVRVWRVRMKRKVKTEQRN